MILRNRGTSATVTGVMPLNVTVNPTSQHELFLKLFITNGGGW